MPLFDLQAGIDPFKPEETRNELKDEFGDRVTIAGDPGREPRALARAAGRGGGGDCRVGEEVEVRKQDFCLRDPGMIYASF